jgi:mRNA-degrading endonuclease HigB of HigAB toxin-antitoxin module
MTIQEEKFLFNNDLPRYKESEQGKALKRAFDTNNNVEQALIDYYTARENNTFTYTTPQDLENAIALERRLADYYRDLD